MTNQSVTYKIAQPYAEALLSAVKDLNIVNQTQVEILSLSNLLSESIELKNFLANPLMTSSLKKDLLKELLANQVSECLLKFLLVLVDRRRIYLLSAIIDKYLELAYELESTTVVEILTAIILTEGQQEALSEKLKIMTNSKNIRLLFSTDTSLIGGFIAKVGSKVIDTSISGKLKNMAFYLSSV
uniref:ATP synthase CF1 delta subunit n=1 Tax=Gelidium elegans TaxID=37200 RepID=A0A141SDE1_GELEL|nr:ATP synthase CF1 delta subunit [Gelidium elegans]AMK96309.1 ATP synthase CF1 delta subunit [Gelidium elegans]